MVCVRVIAVWLVAGLFWGALMGLVVDLSWAAALGSGTAWGVVSGLVFCVWIRRRDRAERR